MKTQFLTLGIIAVALLATVGTVMAKTTPFTLSYNQAQFQWRAFGGPFGAWSSVYQNDPVTGDGPYTLQGNSLHSTITFSPIVTNVQGASTNYVYDKSSGLWIQHEGTISYNIANYYCRDSDAVCSGPYTTYWRGYLDFGGNTLSDAKFVHGVVYQWVYYYSPHSDTTVLANLPNAIWDSKVGAWLIGFSVYLYDKGTQSYGNIIGGSVPIDTVAVPADNPTPTLSTATLTNGVQYELVAFGTANAGDNIEFDAMCSYRTGSSTEWTNSVSTYESYGPQLLDLYVNSFDFTKIQTPNWGTACSPDHTYSMTITGAGTTVPFQVNDIYYPNNAGSITVDIYGNPVLFPTPFIEPVPANIYNPLNL